jgi:hypothetical protein
LHYFTFLKKHKYASAITVLCLCFPLQLFNQTSVAQLQTAPKLRYEKVRAFFFQFGQQFYQIVIHQQMFGWGLYQ